MSSIIAPKFVTRPNSSISMSRYMIGQRRAAQKAGQARPDTATLKSQYKQIFGEPTDVGLTSPLSDGPNMPRPTDTGMPKATPKGGSQAPQPYNPYDVETLKKLNPNFSDNFGDTSVKNLNTIGAPAPAGATSTFQGGATGGTPNIAAGTPADFFNKPTTPPPPGAMFKKGGKVKAKKMASGGMTSKVSSASSRADGIAQRGKTKCKMY